MKPTDGRCQTGIRHFRVKVFSPETTNIGGVDSVHSLEDRTRHTVKARCVPSFRGLSPWYGTARKSQEPGRAWVNSRRIGIVISDPKRRVSGESTQAVGPTHSRGVAGVMSGESNIDTRRGWQYCAKVKGDIIKSLRGAMR